MYQPYPMRASDAEREATIALLQRATAEGRLTLDEFSERTQRAYVSTTRDQLAALVADLPIMPVYPVPPPPPPQTSSLPLLALIFGVISLPTFFCIPLGAATGVPAVVLGTVSLRRMRRGMPGNRAMALTGLICGSVGVLLQIAMIVFIGGFGG